jgi:predicted dithiol-disulfide oxidoreductase (DUF899 family)
MNVPKVVNAADWLIARREFLDREKAFTLARDELTAARRELPMTAVDKEYVFGGPDGDRSLLDLFEGRRQLILHHVMFDPSWDEGCSSCRRQIRDLGYLPHLYEHDTSLALVSRAPADKIAAYKRQMGWTVPYYSSFGSDFNYDFHVTLDESIEPVQINFRTKAEHEHAVGPWDIWGTELPAVSVFLRDDDDNIFLTYSAFARGLDILMFHLNYLDLTALGRDAQGTASWKQLSLPDRS